MTFNESDRQRRVSSCAAFDHPGQCARRGAREAGAAETVAEAFDTDEETARAWLGRHLGDADREAVAALDDRVAELRDLDPGPRLVIVDEAARPTGRRDLGLDLARILELSRRRKASVETVSRRRWSP